MKPWSRLAQELLGRIQARQSPEWVMRGVQIQGESDYASDITTTMRQRNETQILQEAARLRRLFGWPLSRIAAHMKATYGIELSAQRILFMLNKKS